MGFLASFKPQIRQKLCAQKTTVFLAFFSKLTEGICDHTGANFIQASALSAKTICAVRLCGRFLNQVHDLSPYIVNYLGQQLDLPHLWQLRCLNRVATG